MNVELEAKSSATHSSALQRIKSSCLTENQKKLFELAYQLGFCDGILKGTEELSSKIIDIKDEILFRSGLRDSQ